jgi:hypothetical protein
MIDIIAIFGLLANAAQILQYADSKRPSSEESDTPSRELEIEYVGSTFPADSGIGRILDSEGYKWRWSSTKGYARHIYQEGYEVVVIQVRSGRLFKLKTQDLTGDMILIRKRKEIP